MQFHVLPNTNITDTIFFNQTNGKQFGQSKIYEYLQDISMKLGSIHNDICSWEVSSILVGSWDPRILPNQFIILPKVICSINAFQKHLYT